MTKILKAEAIVPNKSFSFDVPDSDLGELVRAIRPAIDLEGAFSGYQERGYGSQMTTYEHGTYAEYPAPFVAKITRAVLDAGETTTRVELTSRSRDISAISFGIAYCV